MGVTRGWARRRRRRPGQLRGEVAGVEAERWQPPLRFAIPDPALPRAHGPILVADDVAFRHPAPGGGGGGGERRPFELREVRLCVEAGQRVAVGRRGWARDFDG